MNCLFLNTNFALKLSGKCWKDDVVTFTALLSVTIKRLTRYKQKVVFAAMLEGKSIPSNMVANTNHTTLLKNQSAIKCLPYMRFLSNFGCKIIFMCSVKFWQDFNALFKESMVMWPSASGLLGELSSAHEKFASEQGLCASGWLKIYFNQSEN